MNCNSERIPCPDLSGLQGASIFICFAAAFFEKPTYSCYQAGGLRWPKVYDMYVKGIQSVWTYRIDRSTYLVLGGGAVMRDCLRNMSTIFLLGCVYCFVGFCTFGYATEKGFHTANTNRGGGIMTLTVTSRAFSHNGEIPLRYTCDGEDISPPLEWSGLPEGTKSVVLIVDDPDAPDPAAPKMTWVHWVLYNIPPDAAGLPEAVQSQDLPAGTKEGLNDWKRTGYGGPCPPIGRHRYFHKLYALDVVLPDLGNPTKQELEKAMGEHILAKAEIIGTYQRSR
jgi:Raf kinase inhibitor-like YbhB/YbcL family protein